MQDAASVIQDTLSLQLGIDMTRIPVLLILFRLMYVQITLAGFCDVIAQFIMVR